MLFNKFVAGGGGGVAERQGAQREGQLGAAGGNPRHGARQEEGGAAAGEAAQPRPVRRGGNSNRFINIASIHNTVSFSIYTTFH